jgi:predicted transposase YdaD
VNTNRPKDDTNNSKNKYRHQHIYLSEHKKTKQNTNQPNSVLTVFHSLNREK